MTREDMTIGERYEAGESLLALAADTGWCVTTIRNIVVKEGVQMRARGMPRGGRRTTLTDREVDIIARFNAGNTLALIGEHYGVSRERIRQILARCGRVGKRRGNTPVKERRRMSSDEGRYIYFALAECGLVKIGTSVQPEERLQAIAEWVPFRITLAATMPGGFEIEAALHKMFTDEWMFGEWFWLSDRLSQTMEDAAAGRPINVVGYCGASPKNLIKAAKQRASIRVTWAEKRAGCSGYRAWTRRPQHVQDALASFDGPHRPPPSPDALAVLEEYIASLQCIEPWVPASERAA